MLENFLKWFTLPSWDGRAPKFPEVKDLPETEHPVSAVWNPPPVPPSNALMHEGYRSFEAPPSKNVPTTKEPVSSIPLAPTLKSAQVILHEGSIPPATSRLYKLQEGNKPSEESLKSEWDFDIFK